MDIAKTIKIPPGRYVLAVSGGVDSMALLDLLVKINQSTALNTRDSGLVTSDTTRAYGLVVAHFDHGIREDSKLDRILVEKLARTHKLPFVYDEGNLSKDASEDKARTARYEFLRKVQKQTNSDGILTAHHLDDVMETATHNILRGTGRKGISSLKSVDGLVRPLLHLPKAHLLNYASNNKLEWREDSTNQDMAYRRNYIRHKFLPRLKELSPEKYMLLQQIIKRHHDLNVAIDNILTTFLHVQPSTSTLRRYDVITLPHSVARELVGEWLRLNGKRQFNRKQLEHTTVAIKTARTSTTLQLDSEHHIKFDQKHAHLKKVLSTKSRVLS